MILVDPRQTKHAPGRPKSDVLDCQWIRRLHSYGLLTASFRPADEIVVWRGFQRQREMLIRYAAQHVQHMQKALEEMNVKLTEVVSDIVGQTGLKIIQDIVRGERDPLKLARHRHERCKATEAEIASALFLGHGADLVRGRALGRQGPSPFLRRLLVRHRDELRDESVLFGLGLFLPFLVAARAAEAEAS